MPLTNGRTLILLILLSCPVFSADNLHILPPDNIDRLRFDFNASRSKVRMVFMLSPT